MTISNAWAPPDAAVTLIAASKFDNLVNGGWVSSATAGGAPFDNRTNYRPYFRGGLVLPSALTAGASAPYVALFAVPCLDLTGGAWPDPPALLAEACPAQYHVANGLAIPSASFTSCNFPEFILGPFVYHFLMQNNLGATLQSSGAFALTGNTFTESAA